MMPNKTPETWYWDEHWNRSRQGSLPIALEWPGGRAEGILFEEGTPRTAKGVAELLPVEFPIVHVAWSGEMIMSAQSFDLGFREKENETRLPRVGDMSWDPVFGELAFTYGTAECRMPSGFNTVVVYGSLTSNLDDLAAFCRARRFEGVETVKLAEAS